MKESVEMIVKALVDEVEAVDVRAIDREGATLIEVRVAPGDMGKIIGRQGRTRLAFPGLCGEFEEATSLHSRNCGMSP
jgi:predicted RNA-binding protein YlqC (UPF0109 family)